MEWLSILQDYGGVIVGAIILTVATHLLPGRVRWYVLTAGLAVLGYRAWQIYSTNERFKKWDQDHDELKRQFAEIKQQRDQLAGDLDKLKDGLRVVEQQRDELKKQSAQLSGQGATLADSKRDLDKRARELDQQSQQTDQKITRLQDAAALVDKAEALLQQHKTVASDTSDTDLMKMAQGIK